LSDVILKKALLKENFFLRVENAAPVGAFMFSQPIVSNEQPVVFDITLTNQMPIKAQTSFLEIEANIDAELSFLYGNNRINNPRIAGNLQLEKGALKFLHHTLYIDYGKFNFIPNQMNDITVDLVAKNKIKKYLIVLTVTGLLQSPHIILESFPELSQEQILSLLIAGSEDVSFKTDFPAILVQNLNSLIVRNKHMLPKAKSFFEKLTLPFKYVQITPDFTNQFEHKGIKGTLSIDVNKQIHAQIQKNFNLHDDLGVQIEYFLTDDVNFKVMKDQRGEIGSEVEVRFKL
jgi:hypothetical protein